MVSGPLMPVVGLGDFSVFGILVCHRLSQHQQHRGKVASHKTDLTLNGFVTARLVDVRTGGIVGTIHRPSGLLMANSEHQCVMAAAKRAAQALGDQLR